MRSFYDVDAGPIIAGFSPAANAFGLAAAKVNGRLDHAYTLGTQIIAATWPRWLRKATQVSSVGLIRSTSTSRVYEDSIKYHTKRTEAVD